MTALPIVSPSAPAPTLAVVDGVPTTTSTDVAHHFGKQHRDVLRAIENLTAQLPAEALRNFAQGSYTLPETGEQQHKLYRLTRDGFTLLAMGFTGKKALAFKLAYIDAFNRMEAQLHEQVPASTSPLTDRIRAAAAMFHDMHTAGVATLGLGPRSAAQAANQLVIEATGIDFLGLAGNPHLLLEDHRPRVNPDLVERISSYVSRADAFRDKAYQAPPGVLPAAKLLKLMKLRASELRPLVQTAIDAGRIRECRGGYISAWKADPK